MIEYCLKWNDRFQYFDRCACRLSAGLFPLIVHTRKSLHCVFGASYANDAEQSRKFPGSSWGHGFALVGLPAFYKVLSALISFWSSL